MADNVEDGFGSVWPPCEKHDRRLEVVRPGDARCPECETEEYVDRLQARVEALEKALRDLENAVRVFREYAGRHEGMHDSALTVCSRCNASYVGAESRLDEAREAARKLLEEK